MKHANLWSGLTALIILIWAVFAICKNVNEDDCVILWTHAVFLILLVFLIIISFRVNKQEFELELRAEEYERKEKWENFQYDLYKEEREFNQRYEKIKTLIEKLDNKEVVDNHKLKQEIDKFRKELDEWKEKKDKQLLIELSNKLNKKICIDLK